MAHHPAGSDTPAAREQEPLRLPVLAGRSPDGEPYELIDGGMARGVPDASARTRTITVYTDVRKVVRDLGLAGTDTIAVLLLERPGDVIARELGAFDQQKAKRLAAALEPERIARA